MNKPKYKPVVLDTGLRTCPKCKQIGVGEVIDSRPKPGGWILRRRRCQYCLTLWRSAEIPYEDFQKIRETIEK